MILRSLALAMLLLFSTAVSAGAGGTFYTPLARAEAGGGVFCLAVNIGKKPDTLVVTVIDNNGATRNSQTCSAAPGAGCGAGTGDSVFAYCRIAFNGSKKAVRGNLAVVDANDNTILSLEAR